MLVNTDTLLWHLPRCCSQRVRARFRAVRQLAQKAAQALLRQQPTGGAPIHLQGPVPPRC